MKSKTKGIHGGGLSIMAVSCALISVWPSLAVAATDGFFWSVENSVTRKTATAAYWENLTIPGDGGIASFAASPASLVLDNDISGWTLGGLKLNGFLAVVKGNPITLTGDAAVSGDGEAKFLCTIQAAQGATLGKFGTGSVLLTAPFTGFSSVKTVLGTLIATNMEGTVFSTTAMTLAGGMLRWAPSGAAGTAAATIGGESLAIRGNAEIDIEHGSASSATLTVPTLDLSERAPVLKILASGGSASLGAADKVKVSGTAPAVVNGTVDPRIVTRGSETGRPITLLTYDATDGFKPVEVTGAATDADAATKPVKITADTTLPANAAVGALVVQGTPTVTGSGLTVGDGTHPAAIVFNDSGNNTIDFSGAGTIAFGNAPGILWQNHKDSNAGVWASSGGKITLPTITGTQGVTFASWMGSGHCVFASGSDGKLAAGWTGPTRIVGNAQFQHNSRACLPEGDIYVEGGELYTTYGMTYENRHFYFSNRGGKSASYRTGGSPDLFFKCPVTLEDTAVFMHDNNGCFWFQGGVDGKGGIELIHVGRVAFTAPNTFEGGVTAGESSLRIHVEGKGTLGTGQIVAQGNNPTPPENSGALRFYNNFNDGRAVITHPNKFTVTGYGLELINSCVAFTGPFKANTTRISDRVRVGVGADVDFGDLSSLGNLDFYAAAPESRLVFSTTTDRVLSFNTLAESGGNRLSIEKEGSGTLTLSGAERHSGEFVIRDGTVKIDANVLHSPSIRYWLDASDESTQTTDGDGYVTEWRSKVGDVKFSVPVPAECTSSFQFRGPRGTETLNGKKVLSFRRDAANGVYQRLVSDVAVPNRHVFMVLRLPSGQDGNAGIFGKFNADYGVRVNWNGSFEFSTNGQYNTRSMRVNAVENNLYTVGRYELAEFMHDEYDGNVSATKDAVFRVIFGGYFQWSPWRNADFDVAEIIDFDRILTDEERRQVENYLQEKWALTGLAQQEAAEPKILSPDSALVLADPSATLDLNGSSQTVEALSGFGRIVNSSPTQAVLKVVGASDFKGTIDSNVRLDLSEVEDVTLGTLNALPVRDGLSFWVDASYKPEDYVVTNAAGEVTQWKCRAGTVASFNETGNSTRTRPKCWSATGMAGSKPGVYFDGNKTDGYGNSLAASSACSIRTLFLVGQYVSSSGNSGFFGISGSDVGYRAGPSFRTGDALTCCGDDVFVNETDYTGKLSAQMVANGVSVLRVRTQGDRPNLTNKTFALGQYIHWNVGHKIWFGEVIAYNRRLTDGEFSAVTKYLNAKWRADNPMPRDVEGEAFELPGIVVGPGATTLTGDIAATGDWMFDFGNATALDAPLLTVDGTLSLSAATARFSNYTSLTMNVKHTYLEATTLVGDFNSVLLDTRRFRRIAEANTQKMQHFIPGATIILR